MMQPVHGTTLLMSEIISKDFGMLPKVVGKHWDGITSATRMHAPIAVQAAFSEVYRSP